MNETRFIKSAVGNGDFVASYFKRDVPCFQFTGFQAEDKAGRVEVNQLLNAIVLTGDWAAAQCEKLSDQYPAHHNLPVPTSFATPRGIGIPIGKQQHRPEETLNGRQIDGSAMSYILIRADGVVIVPPVWVNEGATQMQWGRLEAAVGEALKLL